MKQLNKKIVFFISDGTGITAETFAHSVLAQFEDEYVFTQIREPFINTEEKAIKVANKINELAKTDIPLAFSTLINVNIANYIKNSNCVFIDLLEPFVSLISNKLNVKPSIKQGLSHSNTHNKNYQNRIEAINFTLEHDDGQFIYALDNAQIILIGVSRSAKTPTSLYLAMQYGIKVANYPLTPDDFKACALPNALKPYKNKLFGLSIDPYRLSEIRNERLPNSEYASIINCKNEVKNAEFLMKINNIPFLNITNKSIEEVTSTLLDIFDIHN
ncbi:kinase/pyrophosphorylase [Campylobacter sp. RM12640]|uniref:posphoenolpyruvate synthetase regulatory kinase/phosphorylase PpsR n=1 Tax=unclassified Campylobacter TaxID=2593542 RepID=UPI0030151FB1|nr:kinase/pyrophosphorylase [Campylobacter sp. RM12640]MBZ7989438.1 kinase/pyrophosphorylase [Campylobacter sp. RM12635]